MEETAYNCESCGLHRLLTSKSSAAPNGTKDEPKWLRAVKVRIPTQAGHKPKAVGRAWQSHDPDPWQFQPFPATCIHQQYDCSPRAGWGWRKLTSMFAALTKI